MSGTKSGAKKAMVTLLTRNPNHFKEIGSIGGKNGHTGGFAANPELARIAGSKGGRISRRGKNRDEQPTEEELNTFAKMQAETEIE